MTAQSAYRYISTKNETIEEMKKSSRLTIVSLKNNITNLMASYAINEYESLIENEMEHRAHFAIVVEDYNMGKILGQSSYVSGKIRNVDGYIINFDPKNSEHIKKLENIFYTNNDVIVTSLGKKLGVIRIYISDKTLNKELNQIITHTIIDAIGISLLLIVSLILAIRWFILKPVTNITDIISRSDADGIPFELIPVRGSAEIFVLTKTMNNMISSIKESRIILTEQRNELKKNEDQLKTLSQATEQSPVAVIICSPENIIEYVNPQFEKTSGYTTDEVVGHSIEFLFKRDEPSKQKIIEYKRALESGERWIGELSPLTKKGDSYTIRMSVSSISSKNGQVVRYIYVAEDITDQKRNEEMLRNSQKMDAVGQLTGGIAHDFNNILGIIMGNLELLQLSMKGQPNNLERIDSAMAGATRGAQLTRKLLNFSRQEHIQKEITQVNAFIENLRELIEKSVTAIITVEIQLEKKLWQVEIDPGDLEDAILNLSLNARDAMPNGGMLVIETSNSHIDSGFVSHNPGARVGDFVKVSVSDNGSGMSEEVRKKIFDPFFSTKEFGKGSGLGLSMVYGFVQRTGGFIQIYSEEGEGSVFHIYLPRAAKENDTPETLEDNTELPRGNERILIVDDEISLAKTCEHYLQQLGYKTVLANSGNEALGILSEIKDIDLMFSDVVMPNMDGFDLAFTVAKHYPDVKILMTSGFTSKRMELEKDNQTSVRKLAENLLTKPYNLRELSVAVRDALDK